MTYVKSRLVNASDIPPSRAIGTVLRVLWADLAQLGLSHSREVSKILDCFKEACEHHPAVTGCILFMPNTPKLGKGLKADALREQNIKDAVNDVKSSVLTFTALSNQIGHCIIDPDSMYSTERPCTIEFASIISSEKKRPMGSTKACSRKGSRIGVEVSQSLSRSCTGVSLLTWRTSLQPPHVETWVRRRNANIGIAGEASTRPCSSTSSRIWASRRTLGSRCSI